MLSIDGSCVYKIPFLILLINFSVKLNESNLIFLYSNNLSFN